MSKRAAIYLRVSRVDQNSWLQKDETIELVHRRSWTLIEQFSDEGISGAHGRRPGLKALMEAARQRRFDALVVYRSDRLFRSLHELVNTLAELAALGIDFVSVHEPFDTTTPSGKLLVQLVGSFAEFERNILIERTKSGLAAARRRGAVLGRPKRHVDVDRVLALRAAGVPFTRIARELEVGVATIYRAVGASSMSLSKTVPPRGSQPRDSA